MLVRATAGAARPQRALACRKVANRRVSRARHSLKVQALFGGRPSAPSGGDEGVASLVSIAKRQGGPSENANAAVADAVRFAPPTGLHSHAALSGFADSAQTSDRPATTNPGQ